jgi:hypothetical protein|tara:strand:- start:111 stop:434 length:324 start_codon:yes stop_codon:yes gene_type:complete
MEEDIEAPEVILPPQEVESTETVKLLQQAIDVLESIDKSIDFLSAAMTGMDPLEIQMGQTALGRLALPHMRTAAGPQEPKVDESVAINQTLLEEIIEEEIRHLLEKK